MELDIAEQEYSLQHYDFTPEKFYKDFSEMIIRELALVVHETMKCVGQQSDNEKVQEYFIKMYSKFHSDWSQRSIMVLEDIKPLIYEFFKIPPNVLLPSDAIKAIQVAEEQIIEIQNEVAQLEKECLQELTRKKQYLAELESLSKLTPIKKNFDKAVKVMKRFQTTLQDIQEYDSLIKLNADNYQNTTKQNISEIHVLHSDDEIEQEHKFVLMNNTDL